MFLTIFLPLLNFLILACFGRALGKMGTLYSIFLNTCLGIGYNFYLFIYINQFSTAYYLSLGSWMTVNTLDLQWEFVLDSLSVIMLLMVSIISALVHYYSIDYMRLDPHFIRFMSYLSLFTFFMFLLVTSTNFIQLFVGWEGVGICSYLLINFWTTRLQASKAAIKAVLMNRVGDIGYLIGIALLYTSVSSLDFSVLYVLISVAPETLSFAVIPHTVDTICGFLLVGVIAKSAQIGLHTWLPAAMEGPTPVSALIHAATMVTAGIFLVIRTSFLFELSPWACQIAVCFGIITAFFSALTAVFLYDIKRIIAYSTCSQLGYMLLAAGLSQYHISLFHLINHAFFKALLFLTAGAIIHSFGNEQDIRKLGLVYQRAPLLFASLFIGNVAIMGLPFLAGYYSKDLILEVAWIRLHFLFSPLICDLLFILICGATCLTAVYSCRVIYYIVFRVRQYRLSTSFLSYLNQPLFMRGVLVILSLFSLFSGYIFSDFFAQTNLSMLPSVFAIQAVNSVGLEFEFLLPAQKILPVVLNLGVVSIFFCTLYFSLFKNNMVRWNGFLVFYFASNFGLAVSSFNFWLWCKLVYYYMRYNPFVRSLFACFSLNFYFNECYNFFVTCSFYLFYTSVFLKFDKGLLEIWGPTGLSRCYQWCVKFSNQIYKASFKSYLFTFYTVLVLYYFIIIFFN